MDKNDKKIRTVKDLMRVYLPKAYGEELSEELPGSPKAQGTGLALDLLFQFKKDLSGIL